MAALAATGSLVSSVVDCRLRARIASVSDGWSSLRTAAAATAAAEANNWAVAYRLHRFVVSHRRRPNYLRVFD